LLFSQTTAFNNPTETTKNDPSKSAEAIDQIQLKPLYTPDPNYQQTISKAQNNTQQINNPQNNPLTITGQQQQLIKPDVWLFESSFNNAPMVLKGIFAYLQSRLHSNRAQYSVSIPSFHRFILVGPPGSGKTTLAHAIAYMLGHSIVFVPATSLLGKYRNETARNITHFLKKTIERGINIVIIIDELHKLFEHHASDRSDDSQTAAAFWLMLDDIEQYNHHVIIIGTANSVSKLPPEIKSRFSGKIITLPLPDTDQKIEAFKNSITYDQSVILSESVSDEFIAEIVRKDNSSLRDVRFIIDSAKIFYYAKNPLHDNNFPIILEKEHFQQALAQLRTESFLLEESNPDAFYKRLQEWGMILSAAVNAITLFKAAANFLKIKL